MLVNFCVIGWLSKRFSERSIVRGGTLLVGLSLLASAWWSFNLPTLLAYLFPMTVAGAVCATMLTSALTQCARTSDAGSLLGLDMSVGSASRVLAPSVGGWLLTHGYQTVGTAAAALAALALLCASSGGEGGEGVWGGPARKVAQPAAGAEAPHAAQGAAASSGTKEVAASADVLPSSKKEL
jgi:predicted MFS family arabinose efflux permease